MLCRVRTPAARRRQRLAATLRRWDEQRAARTYILRIVLAQRIMPAHMRLPTLILWASLEEARLDYYLEEEQRLREELTYLEGPGGVPVEILQRFM